MCGISGYIHTGSKTIKDTSEIIAMMRVQKHRGPDDSGLMAFNLNTGLAREYDHKTPVSLEENFDGIFGFNRLSILDLSQNGHQPMMNPDKNVILMLNGEIYNAFDYKNELEKWGYRFKSTSDTEIVLALFLRYGLEGMLERLNGMFAVVMADLRGKRLLIARDRFGIKPMYYVWTAETIAFSSEMKSFGFLKGFNFSLREDQLNEYLLFRNNISGTLVRDVESLEPGHFLSYSREKGLSKNRYFSVESYSRNINEDKGLKFYGDMIGSDLGKSVKRQLMSDVKLGCQLSGGIDSSLVTWLANKNSEKGSFEAVSIVFKNQKFTEERFIDTVSINLGIVSHKFLLDSDYYFDNIENATWHLESPLNHPNTVAIYKLSQRAKEYVTVLLSGEGADEVFGGYNRFYDIGYPFRPRKLQSELRKNFAYPAILANYFRHEHRAVMATSFMHPSIAGRIKADFTLSNSIGSRLSLYKNLSGSFFDRQVKYELLTYLPDLLIRQDKMSMAHSIENRVPFLDNEVVEHSFLIPEKHLLLRKSAEGYNNEKYLLKKLTAGTFGTEFAFRNKMGFGIPVREFFLNPRFIGYLNSVILSSVKSRGIFNYKIVSGWLSDLPGLSYTELEALWVILSFEIWALIYLDKKNENWHS